MKRKNLPATLSPESLTRSTEEDDQLPSHDGVQRRSFLKGLGIAGAALSAGALLTTVAGAEEGSGSLTRGDSAILRFLAAAEIIESDLWLQYAELGGFQDNELPLLASQLIPGYPAQQTGGSTGNGCPRWCLNGSK